MFTLTMESTRKFSPSYSNYFWTTVLQSEYFKRPEKLYFYNIRSSGITFSRTNIRILYFS
ncbi:unnamed protein product [Schistosoma mattheei]|uniref:Uncharacterized protein n=1 Tax=Schistosoma mattheei TaxID=31246 RepID=A0AA85ATF9_9TREM|nr:unnamed protein product [Schistosoma mattheei]